jgi:hypothetical protein
MPGVFAVQECFDQIDPLATELNAFVHSIIHQTKPLVDGIEGRRALEVALSMTAQIQPESGGGV